MKRNDKAAEIQGHVHEHGSHAHRQAGGAMHLHKKVVTQAMAPAAPQGPSSLVYTCPMHPQIRHNRPGNCPFCGMSLEPLIATSGTTESPELRDMTRRFWIGLALALPVVVLEMGVHLVDIHHLISQQTSNWIQLAFASPVVLWAGWPFFVRAWASLVNKSLNMFTLIALGTGVAWTYSLVGTVAPQLFSAELRTGDGAIPIYFEAAAVITVLVLLGQVLELRVPSGLCSTWHPKPRFSYRAIATKQCRSIPSRSATCCVFDRARKYPWTAC